MTTRNSIATRIILPLVFGVFFWFSSTITAAEPNLYEVQLEISENGNVTSSPSVILEEDKIATISIGKTEMYLLVKQEGVLEGHQAVSLTVEANRAETTKAGNTVDDNIISTTIFMHEKAQPGAKNSANVSIGAVEMQASINRVDPARVQTLLSADRSPVN